MIEAHTTDAVGVLGATSLVGTCLLPLLCAANYPVVAFTRHPIQSFGQAGEWRQLTSMGTRSMRGDSNAIPLWICIAPIWVLPEYFGLLEQCDVRRVVVVSSTSRYTKNHSSNSAEQLVAHKLADAEASVRRWAECHRVEWVILRPTLIYGFGRDKNISEVARFIRRFGIFPVFGKALGLRQPIHAKDVAAACIAALQAPCAANHDYNISGGETLSYRKMVSRIFVALGYRPRLFTIPLWTFYLAAAAMRHLPRYGQWSASMAERMNQDLVFEHTEAARDLGFKPRRFVLDAEDLPR